MSTVKFKGGKLAAKGVSNPPLGPKKWVKGTKVRVDPGVEEEEYRGAEGEVLEYSTSERKYLIRFTKAPKRFGWVKGLEDFFFSNELEVIAVAAPAVAGKRRKGTKGMSYNVGDMVKVTRPNESNLSCGLTGVEGKVYEVRTNSVYIRSTTSAPNYPVGTTLVFTFDEIDPLVDEAELKKSISKPEKRPHHWYDILEALLKGGATRIALIGPPGTGKSTTAAKTAGRSHRLTLTEGSGVEDLIGMYHLRNGETVWVDGPAVRAMREGSTLVLDEIDHPSAEVMSLLYALLDDEAQVTLPTGEHVKAKDGYTVICTSNANVTALPEPIVDRMEAVLVAMVPHPEAMKVLDAPQKGVVEKFYKALRGDSWTWNGQVTLRRMRAFAKLQKATDEGVVAEAVFGKAGREILSCLVTSGR